MLIAVLINSSIRHCSTPHITLIYDLVLINVYTGVNQRLKNFLMLLTLEKNKRSLLQNLIQINYSSDNLTILIGITWEHKESKAWRNDVLMKFLHHSNLAPSKHRPSALYDAFTKTSILGSKHILALARTFC